MAQATTNKRINLLQLTKELNGIGLTSREHGGVTVVQGDCDQATLDAAIASHVAKPDPPPPEERLQAQIDELADIVLGIG